MKKLLLIIGLSLTALAGAAYLQSCRKTRCQDPSNPDCENYDPCYGKQAPKAHFLMGVSSDQRFRINGVWDSIISDTIFYKTSVFFKTTLQNVNALRWLLGSEVINDKYFRRSFGNAPYGKYSVTHIIEKTPDKACFPNDDGRDTLKRTFYINPFYDFPIVGQYKVLFKGETDSIIFSVLPYEFQPGSGIIFNRKSEEPYLGLSYVSSSSQDTIKSFSDVVISGGTIAFRDGGNPSYPTSGAIFLTGPHAIKANYWYDNKNHIFEGRRVGK
jgi:hypothetical protein